MDLKFRFLANLEPAVSAYTPMDMEYIELHNTLINAQREYLSLADSFNKARTAQTFLKTHQLDNSLYSYFCDLFGMEEYIGLPKGCINTANTKAYTEVCMEGLGSFIGDICKKIAAFFKKLYETIMNFFGIRSFRHRKIENKLTQIKRAVSKMNDAQFRAICASSVQINVPTITTKTMDQISDDMEILCNAIHQSADIESIKTLVTATSGILTKLQFKLVDEFRIETNAQLPYQEIRENIALTPGTEFNIGNASEVIARIDRVLKIQKTILDLQRWYPMNLRKYAARAEKINTTSQDQAQQDIQVLNEDQKCQAYMCKLIMIYMQVVDYLCVRSVATFGVFSHE